MCIRVHVCVTWRRMRCLRFNTYLRRAWEQHGVCGCLSAGETALGGRGWSHPLCLDMFLPVIPIIMAMTADGVEVRWPHPPPSIKLERNTLSIVFYSIHWPPSKLAWSPCHVYFLYVELTMIVLQASPVSVITKVFNMRERVLKANLSFKAP